MREFKRSSFQLFCWLWPLFLLRHSVSPGRWHALTQRFVFSHALAVLLLFTLADPTHSQEGGFELTQNIRHASSIGNVAFSSNGSLLATADSKDVKIWEAQSGRLIRTLAVRGACRIEFAAGRQQLLVSAEHRVSVWNLSDGSKVFGASQGEYTSCDEAAGFTPDGRMIVYQNTSDLKRSILIRNAFSGSVLRSIALRDVRDGSDTEAESLAISPDSQTIAVLLGYSKPTVQLYDIGTGRFLRSLTWGPENYGAGTLVYSRDGSFIAAAKGSKNPAIHVWEARTGTLKAVLRGHEKEIKQLVFLSEGNRLISSSRDSTQVWSISSQKSEGGTAGRKAIALSPDSNTLAVGGSTLALLGAKEFERKKVIGGELDKPNAVSISKDGEFVYVASSSGEILEWSATTGRLTRKMGNKDDAHKDSISSIWTTTENRLVSASLDGEIKVWNLAERTLVKSWRAHPNDGKFEGKFHSRSAAVSPEGRFAFTGGPDRLVKIWDLKTGTLQKAISGHKIGVSAVALSGNGERVASSTWAAPGVPAELIVWDPKRGAKLSSVRLENTHPIWSLAMNEKGDQLVWANWASDPLYLSDTRGVHVLRESDTGDANFLLWLDSTTVLEANSRNLVNAWDTKTRTLKWSFTEHSGSVESLAVAGDLVASAAPDGIRLWRIGERKTLVRLVQSTDGEWIAITPEGFFNASPNGGKLLHLVKGLETYGVDQVYQALFRPDLVREMLAGDPRGLVREAASRLDLNKVMASGGAPRVGVATPLSGAQVLGDQAAVEAEIADQGGGIGKVEWRVNGVTLGVEERGFKRVEDGNSGSAKTLKVTRTLGLTPGENKIAVLAYNEAGLIASEPAEVTVTSVQQAAGKPRLYVLAVGVNDYWDSALKLSYAAPDAKRFGDGLRQAGDKLYEQVEVKTVLDAEATAAKLEGVFAELGKKVRPQDVFVFFLAGHGKTVDARFYFLPQDFRYVGEDSITKKGVGQNQLQDWVSRIKAQKSVLLFDACESGSLVGDKIAMRGIEEKTAIDRMTRAMGRTVLTATTDSKPAIEGYRGHGVFTYTLLAGFNAADANGDGVVDVTELATYVDRRLPDLTYEAFKLRQVPQMSIVGSNFPLASKVVLLSVDGTNPPPVSAAAIPTKPTHVVIAPADVYEQFAGKGGKLEQLPPGTLLSLVKTEQGWVLVARDGKAIGYVAENQIARMQ